MRIMPRFFRVLPVLALLASLASPAQAQIPSFGVTGGLNFGALTDAATANLDNRTGFHIGVFTELGIGPLALRPALLFLSAGDVQVGGVTGGRINASFITIPVDLMFSTGTPLIRPYFLAGPEFRFLVGGSDATIDAREVNIALNAGVGAQLSALIGPEVFLELRYALDVSGLARGYEVAGLPVQESMRLNLFMLRAGVSF
jgi:hypothetical protein